MNRRPNEIIGGIVSVSILASFVLVMILALISPVERNASAATTYIVYMDGLTFKPETISVQVGDTVVWTNNDTFLHTTTADGGAWDSGDMSQGDTFPFTFTAPGTYSYRCSFHASMTGTVIVEQIIPEFSSTALVAIGLLAVFLVAVGIRRKR